jgi:tetratricopeptide (TPR) repeat protein
MPFSRWIPSIALLLASALAPAQALHKAAASPQTAAQQAVKFAETGRCPEALPLLKRLQPQIADKEEKRRAGIDAVHCAMTLGHAGEASEFLERLNQQFPGDPEVLYVSTHTYSDLSLQASQQLMRTAPESYQVHELNAEALETQGKWDDAIAEYRKILEKDPRLPGIHYRIGRVILSAPATDSTADDARKEFQEELEVDPTNAGAEYVLGELAREAQQWPDAIDHFSRATKLDSSFSDAFFGLGRSLISAERFSDAIAPLQAFVKLQPLEPAGHFQLGTAYNRAGRKADADREFALYRKTTSEARQTREDLSKKLTGKTAEPDSSSDPH